jgi:hypothetical protein
VIRRGIVSLLVLVATSGCAATTYDSSITVGSAASTTTVLPTGSAVQLLPQLVQEAATLSGSINGAGDKQAVVARLDALWAAARDEVTHHDRDLATEIGAEVDKSRSAARFNRPGAADKAYRNLTALVQAYLSAA